MQSKLNFLSKFTLLAVLCFMFSCSKTEETVTVSAPLFKVGQAVSTKTPLSGSIKGTLLSDSTYKVGGDVFINENDTLVIQPGAKICFPGNAPYCFVVKANLLYSLWSGKDRSLWS
jgi:hypothetical protein